MMPSLKVHVCLSDCHGKSQNWSSVFYETLVAHLRLTVYMYQWSAVCASSSPILKFNISEASWPILMKSYMKHHWGGGKASGSHHNLKLAVHLHFFHIFASPMYSSTIEHLFIFGGTRQILGVKKNLQRVNGNADLSGCSRF